MGLEGIFVNKREGLLERLQSMWTKDRLTLKDLVLLRIHFLLGEDAALELELHWDNIFAEVNSITGTNLEDIPLGSLLGKQTGRPLKIIDLVFKLFLGAPEKHIRAIEREKKRQEYLEPIEVKDRRNPHYRHALRTATTYVSTTVGRARDIFHKMIEDSSGLERMYKLLAPEIEKDLTNPTAKSDEAKRRDFLRMLHTIDAKRHNNS